MSDTRPSMHAASARCPHRPAVPADVIARPHGGDHRRGAPNFALAEYKAPENFPTDTCPMCKAGLPITKF